jgi:hypothetical protein
MAVEAVYLGFVIGTLLLLTAYALIGPRLARACRVGLWLNALALAVLLLPVCDLLLGSHPPPRATEAAMVLIGRGAIFLAECSLLLVLHFGPHATPYQARQLRPDSTV